MRRWLLGGVKLTVGLLAASILPVGAVMAVSPEEALEAHRMLRACTSVATHFETFPLGADGHDEPVEELKQALAAQAEPRPRFSILDFGEGRDVPPAAREGAVSREH